MNTQRIVVSGQTYYACLDPRASNVPGELGLPTPRQIRHGKGYRFDYGQLPNIQREGLIDHLWTMAECLYGDPEAGPIKRDARRIDAQQRNS